MSAPPVAPSPPRPDVTAGPGAQAPGRRHAPVAAGRGRGEARRSAGTAVLLVGLAALGGFGFSAAFAVGDLVRPVLVGAVGGAGGSLLVTGVLRRRMVLAWAGTLALLAPLALVATAGAPADVIDGVRDGARLILTSAVPMGPSPQALAVPFAVTAAAAFAAMEAAQRAHNAAVPLAAPFVALVVGLAFNLEGSAPVGWAPAGWVVVAALVVAAGRRGVARDEHDAGDGGPGVAVRRVLGLVPVVGLVAGLAPAAGERLPGAAGREAFSLRDLVDQPARPEAAANPLVLVTAWQGGADDPLFTADASGPVERWRLAVLDTYDGVEWTSTAAYVPVGDRLPDPPDAATVAGGAEVRQTVRPGDLDGPWLPVADRVVAAGDEAGDKELLFDTAGGVLVARDGLPPEVYTAASVTPSPDAADLPQARAATDDQADATTELPADLPDDLQAAAHEVAAGAQSDYMRAVAIERWLARSTDPVPFRLAVEALPSGHSVGHLRCFLLAPDRCGRQGSTEQFVASFAVLARAAGLPTRVVVGFEGAGSPGEDEVTAHEATAWPEVRFAGVGWVPFDPVPDPDVTAVPPPPDVAGGGGVPDDPTDTTAGRSGDGADDTVSEPRPDEPAQAGGSPLAPLAAVAAPVVAVLALPAAVRGRRRRRRRRAATPADRVAGAWAEAIDGLAASGAPAEPSAAVEDLVGAGRRTLPEAAAPLSPLGTLVNRARFARGAVSDEDARAAWELSDAFAALRRRGRRPAQRLREYVHLRAPGRGRG